MLLFIMRRLRLFSERLEKGVLRSEKDFQKGLSLLNEDIKEHLEDLEKSSDARLRAEKEEEFKADVKNDIADLEKFARRDLEDLRAPRKTK